MINSAEQKQAIELKIIEEEKRLKERIAKFIDKEKDAQKLLNAVNEEKAKSAEKITQLKNQKRAIEKREQSQERKQRTRRLIQHGALAEKYFNCPGIATVDFEILLDKIVKRVNLDELK